MTDTVSHLAGEVHSRARAHGTTTIATAESCTGGNIAHQITLNAGSSAYFLGGVVSYANDVKQHVLGVPASVLENPGAVSEPCAKAMAEGVRRLLGADLAVATTGIAGPDGGTARKPVGLVYIAFAFAGDTVVEEHVFPGDRAAVIAAATARALAMLSEALAIDDQPKTGAIATGQG